jgi:hypothetical protein
MKPITRPTFTFPDPLAYPTLAVALLDLLAHGWLMRGEYRPCEGEEIDFDGCMRRLRDDFGICLNEVSFPSGFVLRPLEGETWGDTMDRAAASLASDKGRAWLDCVGATLRLKARMRAQDLCELARFVHLEA